MPALTAILHTHNDALRIARAVESLRPCDEVLVIDHASSDETCRVAREFGARVVAAAAGSSEADFLREARHDWIFFLLPTESLSEGLEASLYEWKLREELPVAEQKVYAVGILEETHSEWVTHTPEARLAHRVHVRWDAGRLAASENSCVLDGHLLRLRIP